ncbi:MAG: single-stranded DNA-binding protein [Acidobacteria bacterium]|nr:single-stranded DNA-binding protein [Acidobacteriota bacterium]
MARGVNKVILVGNLGRDPELSYLPSGQSVAKFSLATSRSYKDKNGEMKEETEWHNIVAWGKLGEICAQYLSKGRQAYIEGRIQSRTWEGKDGNKRTSVDIVASDVQMLGGRPEGGAAGAPRTSSSQRSSTPSSEPASEESFDQSPPAGITDDDIPF